MSPARRSVRRREWPRGLYEPRPGYYTWRHPTTGENFTLGSIPFAHARNQALQANAHLQASAPSLVDRLTGATKTVGDLLDVMPASENPNTIKSRRSMDKVIRAAIGARACHALTVKDCAEVIDPIVDAGKGRWAQSVRSRLVAMCQVGMQKGWMTTNPAEVTAQPVVVVQRQRLSLEQFHAVYAKAPQVAEWLQDAMMLALVTGQDRSTVAKMAKTDIAGDALICARSKTNVRVAIPLALRMDVLGVTLRDLVMKPPRVVSRLLVHHQVPYGNAPVGSKVHPDRISHAFTEARALAGIPDKGAPTFHEIRSLCKRLYDEQGGVDTKALLGHKDEKSAKLYADTRDDAPMVVKLG
jgi:enterobacteria phage integrase